MSDALRPTMTFEFWIDEFKAPDAARSSPAMVCWFAEPKAWDCLLDAITTVTGSLIRRWPHSPWFAADGSNEFPFEDPSVPDKEWINEWNQIGLRHFWDGQIYVPATVTSGTLDTFVNICGYYDPKEVSCKLDSVCQLVDWILYALDEDHYAFVTSRQHEAWIAELKRIGGFGSKHQFTDWRESQW